jgi:hypothetical protein
VFQRYVASILYRCYKSRSDVAHVAIAIYICFKCIFQIFYLFQMYVASVSFGYCKSRSGCCIYASVLGVFICMLQVFYLDICNSYPRVFKFLLVFCKCFRRVAKCFSCFRRMLQVFYFDIVKVDQVLHML